MEKPKETIRLETLHVEEQDSHQRLDSFLVSRFPALSRSRIQRSVAKGKARVDGVVAKASLRLKIGQSVEFELPQPISDLQLPENIPLDILFQDEHLVAINKPAGMVVHPSKGHWSGTLTAALAFHFNQLSTVGGATRPGIVHRLDRDTSGVIIVAKTDRAHAGLAQQFEARTVEKEYWALVTPAPDKDRDIIDQPIGAHPYQREKKAIRAGHSTSRPSQTYFEVVQRFRGFAVVRVKPKTGRTHQIRVHMAHLGCPVLCDRLYSGRARLSVSDLAGRAIEPDEWLLERQALHAHRLQFDHPATGTRMDIAAPLPQDLSATFEAICKFRGI